MSQIYRIDYDTSYNSNPSFEYAISYENALKFKKYLERTEHLTHKVTIEAVNTIDDWIIKQEMDNV